jgi:phosphatidylglycerophosphatase A
VTPSSTPAVDPVPPAAARRANARFMWRHPARLVALGFGSGLSPWAPGTAGTLWAWVAFLVLDRWLDAADWGVLIAIAFWLGVWACTRTARELQTSDPGSIVWDEIVAFWIVLWVLLPAGLATQVAAFALFRYLDAVKPGPVGWADRLFKVRPGAPVGWAQGFGILFDDLVAAGGTLVVIALSVALWRAFE